MAEATVRRENVGAVAIVELHRSERKNALTGPMFDEIAAQVTAADEDPSVGAMVLCGAGGSFCSGLDLDEYRADPPPPWLAAAPQSVLAAHQALATCRVPIVVALERYAINAGASLAMSGDLMVAGAEAWLQVMEAPMGMAAPMNVAWLVAKYPLSTVMQVVLTGDRFDGGALQQMQIAHEVVAADQVRPRAVELAARLAEYPDGAAAKMKASVLRVAEWSVADRAQYFEDVAELARWS